MEIDIPRRLMIELARRSPAEQREWLDKCLPADRLLIDAAFEAWSAQGQMSPAGEEWRVWLMLAGRGFGKTRAGAEWINALAREGGKRIALVAASIDEARAVMVEGASGLLAIARRTRTRVKWEPSLGRLTWPRGSQAQLFSGDHPDGLRGPEHDYAWCDELAKWRCAEESWTNVQMGLRRGNRARALITTTPRPMALLRKIMEEPGTITSGGRTGDNVNLSRPFLAVMTETYGGTRIGRQELDGELIEDVEGSLWPRALIERCRVSALTLPPPSGGGPLPLPQGERGLEFDRIVVGVDPPAGAGEHCDACGIVVAARRGEEFFVLADESVQGLSPDGWARAVAVAAERWGADRVVAEANNGGEMVRSCLVAAGATVRPKLVHASRGKVARAEPIALRFEAGKAWFAGCFPALEDELSGLSIGGRYEGPGKSPDRADAMVWAMTELAEGRRSMPGVRRL
ncbi:MAG: terminase family protein [Pseudomonadota bacterium]